MASSTEGLWLWFGVQAKEGEGWRLRLEGVTFSV